MLRFLTFCLPVAATLGGAAYVASDRTILAQIGLAPGRGELRALSAPRHPAPPRPAGIRQGGPVCYDVPLWPADGGGLPRFMLSPGPYPYAYARTLGTQLDSQIIAASTASVVPLYGIAAHSVSGSAGSWPGRPVPVPEPSSFVLFLAGLVGIFFARQRRI